MKYILLSVAALVAVAGLTFYKVPAKALALVGGLVKQAPEQAAPEQVSLVGGLVKQAPEQATPEQVALVGGLVKE